jgi:hypothetical protein
MPWHGTVLPQASSHDDDLPTLYWKEGRKSYDSQAPQEARAVGQKRGASAKRMTGMDFATEPSVFIE